jgi:hypothetical protein
VNEDALRDIDPIVGNGPPMILQWLETAGRAEVERAMLIIDQWRKDGMKRVLSVPAEARLVQLIGGQWTPVLPPTPDEQTRARTAIVDSWLRDEWMVQTCDKDETEAKIGQVRAEGWQLFQRFACNERIDHLTFVRARKV